MTGELGQAVSYRLRAAELLAEAVNARDADTKKGLTQIADNYLQLAKMIEDRTDLPRGSGANAV